MINLLLETIEKLKDNNKTSNDVLWVGSRTIKTSWDNFEKVANVEYCDGYGSPEVAQDLLIVGKDFWLERHEYDGSERWEYKTTPKEPTKTFDLKAVTIGQRGDRIGWVDLEDLNSDVTEND